MAILLLTACAGAQDAGRPAFQAMRYHEDWTWLADSSRRMDLFDPVKFMPFEGTNSVELTLTKSLKLTASSDFVWRESLDDGVYGVALNLQVPPGSSQERYVGAFPTVSLAWQAQRHLSFTVNYVAYLFGDFVTQSQPAQRNGNYVSVVATFRF